jgi:CheY-like chemotaxis protein
VSKLLLVIDDDPVERTILERVLVGAGQTCRALERDPALARGPIPLLLQTIAEPTDRA